MEFADRYAVVVGRNRDFRNFRIFFQTLRIWIGLGRQMTCRDGNCYRQVMLFFSGGVTAVKFVDGFCGDFVSFLSIARDRPGGF